VSDAEDLVAAVRRAIGDAADPPRAAQMQAYMKSSMPFRGVGAEPLATVCRTVFAEHPLADRRSWEEAVRSTWDGAEYREERYAALALAKLPRYRAHQATETLGLYRHLIVTGAWWDYVDDIASHLVGSILESDPERVTPIMRRWARDEDLWIRRAAILCQLRRKGHTDLDLLSDALEANMADSRFGSEFFIRKAVGWALRQYARTDPAWVVAFVERHADRLAPLSRREALKNVRPIQARGRRIRASSATAAKSSVR
jgi:3-methyladenine DNA glycosylase AlkD